MKLSETGVESMGFAIPINDVKKYVEFLENKKEIERPSIGVSVIDVSNRFALFRYGYDVDESIESGVLLADIQSNSSAAKAGLKEGDIIVKLDNNKIKSSSELKYYLYQHNVGEKIKVTYIRNKKESTLEMELLKSSN